MKITQLKFQISNYTGVKEHGLGAWAKDHDKCENELYSADDVEECVNDTLHLIEKEGREIVDVRTDFVTVAGHNNGGCNTILEYVTILYK